MTSYSVQSTATPASAFVGVSGMTYLGTKLGSFSDTVAATNFTTLEYDRTGRLRHATALGNSSNSLSQNFDKRFSAFLNTTKDNVTTIDAQPTAASLGTLQYFSNGATTSSTIVSDKTYSYDTVHNTEQVQAMYYPNPSTLQDSIGYDSAYNTGLITSRSRQNCAAVAFSYDSQDRLATIANNGAPEETLAYDATGALVQRVFQKDVNGNPTSARYYIGSHITLSLSSGAITAAYHVSNGRARIASYRPSSSVAWIYFHRDHLGTVIATTWNSSGSERIGSVYRYDLHGNLAAGSESGDTGSEIGYTGGLRLSEGLVYLGARVYDPTLRQFLQPDDVDSHRYSYVHGDPSNRVDPTGHEDKVEPVASPNPFATPEWQAFFAGAGQVSGGTIRGIGGDPDAPIGGGMLDASGTPMMATIGGFLNGWYGALGNRLPAWLRSVGASMGGHWQDDPNVLGADDCGGRECGPLEIAVHGGRMSWVPNDVGGVCSGGGPSCIPRSSHGQPTIPPVAIPPSADIFKNMEQAHLNRANPAFFPRMVGPFGPWDYNGNLGPQFTEFTNFNYGATGTANGWSDQDLLRAAGAAQQVIGRAADGYSNPFSVYPFGDDPADTEMILQGIDFARHYYP